MADGAAAEETARITDCSKKRTVSELITFPPEGTAAEKRYGLEIQGLVRWILNPSRGDRPTSAQVKERVESLIENESTNKDEKIIHEGRTMRREWKNP